MLLHISQRRLIHLWIIVLSILSNNGSGPSQYTNWSNTLTGPVEQYFTPTNSNLPDQEESAKIQFQDFASGLQELRDIVSEAVANQKTVRAHGSKWSFSRVAYNDEYLIDSKGLNFCKIQFHQEQAWFEPAYHAKLNHLVFVQAGVMVKHLQHALLDYKLTLSTTGESDGQRLVGALSTGVHGSAVEYGSIPEMVLAIHIVLPEEDVVLQLATNPVVTTSFATGWLTATRLISDDAMFNAALVSYGSFGIIHGVLIQAEDLFTIQVQTKAMTLFEALPSMQSLDMNRLGFDDAYGPTEIPYDVSFVINPYRLDATDAVYVRVIRKLPWAELPLTAPKSPPQNFFFASVLPTLFVYIARFLLFDIFDLERTFLGWLVQGQLQEFRFEHETYRTYPLVLYTSDNAEKESEDGLVRPFSSEIAVSMNDLPIALDTVLDAAHKMKQPGVIWLRFVAPTMATMGLTAFSPRTATIDFATSVGDVFFSARGSLYCLTTFRHLEFRIVGILANITAKRQSFWLRRMEQKLLRVGKSNEIGYSAVSLEKRSQMIGWLLRGWINGPIESTNPKLQ